MYRISYVVGTQITERMGRTALYIKPDARTPNLPRENREFATENEAREWHRNQVAAENAFLRENPRGARFEVEDVPVLNHLSMKSDFILEKEVNGEWQLVERLNP